MEVEKKEELEENREREENIELEENKEEIKIDEEKQKLESKNENKEEKQEQDNKKEDITIKKYNNYEANVKPKKSKKIIIISIVILILLLIVLFSTGFALLNINNDRILSGITIRDIDVGGLNKEEAIKLLNDELQYQKNKELKLKVNGEITTITLEQIEIEYLIEEAVENAYAIGRSGNILENNFTIFNSIYNKKNLDLNIQYNQELLDNVINGIDAKIPNAMIDNTYNIEDDELIITRGTAGVTLNKENSKEVILNVAKTGLFEDIELDTIYVECPEIDIEKIYNEVYTEPQNAYYTTEPFQIYPHRNGVNFDKELAKQTIQQEEKEEYTIKLIITEPEILTNEIGTEAFPNLLSSFSTKYDETNVSRTTNLKLATGKINGTVVMPGEVFSYNKTVGKRTAEAGYKNANGFSGGRVVQMLGGGICQVSSTLYDAVVYANLNIVERHNHMFQATYVEPGKDATVVYGSLDFKFENTRKYPIMIEATASGGLLQVKVYGVKEEVEYDIEIVTKVLSYTPYSVIYENDTSLTPGAERVAQYGIRGCKSITYKIIKLNGVEVESTVLSSDTYDPQNKIIKRGPTVQTPVEPETTTTSATTQETKPETTTTSATTQETKPEITTPATTTQETKPEATTPATTTQETKPETTTPSTTKPETSTSTEKEPEQSTSTEEPVEQINPTTTDTAVN